MPGVSLCHRRESNIAIELERSIGRIGPGYVLGEITHDLPMRKQELGLTGVRKFQRAKQETRGLEYGNYSRSFAVVMRPYSA
jgi:hypothetical protein